MRIIPVIDVMHGQVVRGVGGRREEYRAIVSKLTTSTAPLDVARAFREHFGLTELYLADLDAIMGGEPALAVLRELKNDGFRIWIDAGLRQAHQAEALFAAGAANVVAGLETLDGPATLTELSRNHGGERIVFSLDLKNGSVLARPGVWPSDDPAAIAEVAVVAGVQAILLLDLAQVGSSQGVGTEKLCQHLRGTYQNLFIVAGGGIRGMDDLRRLDSLGVNAALVASALHDGRITAWSSD